MGQAKEMEKSELDSAQSPESKQDGRGHRKNRSPKVERKEKDNESERRLHVRIVIGSNVAC